MILKGAILFALIILSALLILLSLALLVVGLVKKQSALRTFGLAILLSSTCLFAFTTVYTGSKAWVTAKGTAAKVALWWEKRDFLTLPKPSRHILLLQSYVPEETLKTINPEYYTFFGFRDWWRFPLVYPYSIHAIDTLEDGFLVDESHLKNYLDINRDRIDIRMPPITHLALDRNYLLLRTLSEGYPTESSIEIKYIIFAFSTGTWIEFGRDAEMFAKARELGFTGELELITIDEYANLCYY